MARIREIVIDAVHLAALARFWAAALEGYAVRAYEAAEIARLAAKSRTPESDPAVAVDGPGPTLFFQEAGQPKREARRLCALGATVREVRDGFTVMQDPEGNEFCVQDPA